MPEKTIMTAADIRRAMVRIAHEVMERNRGIEGLVLVGILTRGEPLAKRLVAEIQQFEGLGVPLGALDISMYRDDIGRARTSLPRVRRTNIPVNLTGRRVVLVDDVIFTGRSIRAALDALMDFGRPRSVQLAVLVDRGHRELPIRPDYVGKNVPTSIYEDVQVKLQEIDNEDDMVVIRSGGEGATAEASGDTERGTEGDKRTEREKP